MALYDFLLRLEKDIEIEPINKIELFSNLLGIRRDINKGFVNIKDIDQDKFPKIYSFICDEYTNITEIINFESLIIKNNPDNLLITYSLEEMLADPYYLESEKVRKGFIYNILRYAPEDLARMVLMAINRKFPMPLIVFVEKYLELIKDDIDGKFIIELFQRLYSVEKHQTCNNALIEEQLKALAYAKLSKFLFHLKIFNVKEQFPELILFLNV